jgi:hypothetical protein
VLCGSTYLNQNLRKALERRLATEVYLRDLDQKIDKAVAEFDKDFKNIFDGTEGESFTIRGLRENHGKGFQESRIKLSRYHA